MKKEKILLHATVCYLKKDSDVWLSLKVAKIGAGCRNGYGGGIEKGETQKRTAQRELFEECKVRVLRKNLEKVAIVDFHNTKTDGETFVCRVHFYVTKIWKGKPKQTKEMINPKLFSLNNLPLSEMMPADKIFVPIILSGKKITANFYYGPFQKKLLKKGEIKEVDFLPEA